MRLIASKHSKIVKRVLFNDEDVTSRVATVDTDEQWVILWNTWPPKNADDYDKHYGRVAVEFDPIAQAMFDLGGVLED